MKHFDFDDVWEGWMLLDCVWSLTFKLIWIESFFSTLENVTEQFKYSAILLYIKENLMISRSTSLKPTFSNVKHFVKIAAHSGGTVVTTLTSQQ